MTKFHHGIRYKLWRWEVLRNGYHQCSICGATNELTADHILPRVSHPELAFNVDNGRVLCNTCRVKDMLYSWNQGKLHHTHRQRRKK